jgi:hypothetical protein
MRKHRTDIFGVIYIVFQMVDKGIMMRDISIILLGMAVIFNSITLYRITDRLNKLETEIHNLRY